MAAEAFMVDGSMSFTAGVNSLKPTTVASQQHPDGLARNALSWLNNATVRGGGITCRSGWQYLCTMPIVGNYQGGIMYRPTTGDPYLILSIAGRLYRVRVDAGNTIDEITSPLLRNPAAEPRSYFVQAEQFLVIQAGDNVTKPLIWDGTTLRRSNGADLLFKGYVDQDSIAIPPIDGSSTVTVTLNQPYIGSISDTILLKFEGQFEVMNIVGVQITIRTISSNYAGQTVLRGVFDAFGVYLVQHPEIPAATAMDYYMGRIWYAKGRTTSAGDIVKGPSGSLAYGFSDSVLKVTENPLAVGGDGFTVPSEAGEITALFHTAELDTSLGQGKLYIGTAKAIYRLSVPVSRTEWIAANDATQPLQTVVQLRYGPVGNRCVVHVNGDVFYVTLEPGIRSLVLAVKYFGQWGNTAISRNEDRVLRFTDRTLVHMTSGILFSNRLLMTSFPVQTAVGIAFKAIIPLDFDLISTLEEKLPPAFEGIQEGLDFLELFEDNFNGRQRAFAAVHSKDGTHGIQLWEMTDNLTTDFNVTNERRISWVVETPAYTWGQEFLLKKLIGGELWVDRVFGEVIFKIEYRPDGDACWHFWHEWQICSARNSCEDLENPVCYPIVPYSEGFRQTMSLPRPQEDCQTTSNRQMNWGYQFQARISVTGFCRIRGFIMHANLVEQKLYHDIICPPERVLPAQLPTLTTNPIYTFSNPFDPFLGPPYPPTGYQMNTITRTGDITLLTWTIPDVIIDVQMLVRFAPFITFEITIENYEYPAWNGATPYQVNQRVTEAGIRYVSLTNGNQNHQPPNATFWAVDPTVFELWWFNGSTYVKLADSSNPTSTITWDWNTLTFLAHLTSQGTNPWSFYVVANAGISAKAQSNEFGFIDNCSAPAAPTNYQIDLYTTFSSIDVSWDAVPGVKDYVLAFGTVSGGPYLNKIQKALVPPGGGGNGANVLFTAFGTFYGVVAARTSATCVSAISNEIVVPIPGP